MLWTQQKKMAAPCAGMAGRPLGQFLSCFRRTVAVKTGLRHFSGSSMCRAASQAATVTERATSPWTLMAAVCLQRLPVISADSSPMEQRFRHMLQQVRWLRGTEERAAGGGELKVEMASCFLSRYHREICGLTSSDDVTWPVFCFWQLNYTSGRTSNFRGLMPPFHSISLLC